MATLLMALTHREESIKDERKPYNDLFNFWYLKFDFCLILINSIKEREIQIKVSEAENK